jgi:predicted outer membrane protein
MDKKVNEVTNDQKIQTAHSILRTLACVIAENLAEVEKLLSTSPDKGKKRRNLRQGRMNDFDRQYRNRIIK